MRRIDYPPIWLLATIALAYGINLVALRAGLLWSPMDWAVTLGVCLIFLGIALTIAAALEFSRARTTIIPHQAPVALITTGVYAYSRNPIYLADVLILAGAILAMQALIALPLVPLFALVLRKNFIIPEEKRLEDAFPQEFRAYYSSTRRWV